jgi:RNA polymerase sigma-70 factor (ECF subfamily)
MAADDRRFPTTIWDDIASARGGAERELDLLLSRYRGPVVGFLRWKGVDPDEAEDLAQEVLLRLSRPGFLEKVDRTRGRFRSLLLAVTCNVLSEARRHARAERRGGDLKTFADDQMDPAVASEDDPVFDKLWIAELVARALRELEDDASLRSSPIAAAFRLKYLEGLTQEEVAARLGCGVFNAKNYIHSGKLKFQERILAAVKAYCVTSEEFELEARRLAPYWKKGDP